jgi:hypothetical protein
VPRSFTVFTFTDTAGIVHTQRSSFGYSELSFYAGQPVTVLYESTTSKQSKIYSFQTVWLYPLFITGFGLLFGGIASLVLFLVSRGARLQKQ